VAKAKKRKTRRNVSRAVVHIKATFNNTTVTITDPNGDALCWASSRRKWKRLLIRSPAPSKLKPCEATDGGHGGSRRPAMRPPKTNGRENALAIWVNIAASVQL
jgi:hypothetical protein